jgi:hypothetical protein
MCSKYLCVVLSLLAFCEALPSPASTMPSLKVPATIRMNRNHEIRAAQNIGKLQERLRGGSAAAWNPNQTFNAYFGGLALGVAGVRLVSRAGKSGANNQNGKEATKSAGFLSLQRRFLAVFWLWKLADWLHGPYFYEVSGSHREIRHDCGFQKGALKKCPPSTFCHRCLFPHHIPQTVATLRQRSHLLQSTKTYIAHDMPRGYTLSLGLV